MTKYIKCGGGGLPPQVITDMNAVLNKKFGTSTDYPSSSWPSNIEKMTALPEESASGSIAHFTDGADTVPLKSLTLTLAPTQLGTGDPSPSNPRPISGVSSVNVTSAGKNLFDISKLETTNIIVLNGEATGTGTAFNTAFGNGVDFLKFSSGQMTLTISAYTDGNASTSGNGLRVRFYYTDGTNSYITFLNSDTTKTTKMLTSTSGKVIDYMTISFVSTGSNIWHVSDVQLECGTSSTTFEDYTATTYPISWTDAVYGGYVNEKGEVWATHGVVTFDGNAEETWASYGSQNGFTKSIPTMKSGSAMQDGKSNFLANIATYAGFGIRFGGNNNSTIYLCHITDNISGVTDVASWKTYLQSNNLQVCYPLATPVKIATIDPIVINSALGVNNVWNDGGGDTSLTYRADIDLYVAEHS